MKKFLIFAAAILTLASCGDKKTPKPSTAEITGTWGIVDYLTFSFNADGTGSMQMSDTQAVALSYEFDPATRLLHLTGTGIDSYVEIREKSDKLLTVYTLYDAPTASAVFYDSKYILPRLTDNGAAYAGKNLNGNADALVGRWMPFGDEADDETFVTFRADGKVEMYDPKYDDTETYTYSYKPETHTLTLYAYGDVETGKVELVNDEAAIIYESYYDPEEGTTESEYMMLKRVK